MVFSDAGCEFLLYWLVRVLEIKGLVNIWVREGCEKQALPDKMICGTCLGEVSKDKEMKRQEGRRFRKQMI